MVLLNKCIYLRHKILKKAMNFIQLHHHHFHTGTQAS